METALAKRHKKRKAAVLRPGYNFQREKQDVPVAFERPYESGGERIYDVDPDKKPKINVRETPLEHMYARGVISDGEKRAGDLFRGYCEAVEKGGGVIDPARIKVDHSGAGDPITDATCDASARIRGALGKVGHMDFILLYEVCTVGRSLVEIAKRWYHGLERTPSQANEAGRHLGRRVRDALAVLAKHWRTDGGAGRRQPTEALRGFDKAALDPREWNYSQEKAKADNKARRRRRRRKN